MAKKKKRPRTALAAKATHAGAVVFRRRRKGPQFLLLTPRGQYHQWLLPKGRVEPGESLKETARRETGEETGVDIDIGAKLGKEEFRLRRNGEVTDAVCVYFLAEATGYVSDGVRDSLIEKGKAVVAAKRGAQERAPENRQAKWLRLEEALEEVTFFSAQKLLKRAAKLLAAKEDA